MKNKRTIFLIFIALELAMVLLYYLNPMECPPCPEGMRCDPCFSGWQIVAICSGALIMLLFVSWKMLLLLAELFKKE